MEKEDYSDITDSDPEQLDHAFVIENCKYMINQNDEAVLVEVQKSKNNSLTVPATVEHEGREYDVIAINGRALRESKLTSLDFAPDSKITSLRKDSLYCHSLERVSLPPQCEKLDRGWCNFTLKLKVIDVPQDNSNFKVYQGALYNMDMDVLYFAPRDIKTFEVLNTVKVIYAYCFEQCRHLRAVTFQEEPIVQKIDPWAFSHSGLRSFECPDSIETISYDAFFHCHSLKDITFDEYNSKLKEILISAFKDARLTEIKLPRSCKKIAIAAFADNPKLVKATFCSRDTIVVWRDAFKNCSPDFKWQGYAGTIVKGKGAPEEWKEADLVDP